MRLAFFRLPNETVNVAVLFASQHGRTRKVVGEVVKHLEITPDVFDVKQGIDGSRLANYDVLGFFCPTYGDEELPAAMEDFLAHFSVDLSGKRFLICELGNYYGYDDFSFGPMKAIRRRLFELHGTELCEPLSLDSFPRTAWSHLLQWVEHVNKALQAHDRS